MRATRSAWDIANLDELRNALEEFEIYNHKEKFGEVVLNKFMNERSLIPKYFGVHPE